MFLLDLIRYIRGYVKFRVKGTFVERFLNLAARDRIPVWDGRKRGDEFTGKTIAREYRKLRPHAKKTGVRMKVLEKRGAPFKRQKYRKRVGLPVGLAVFAAIIFIASRFIWRVEVSGNVRVDEATIIESLDKIGVSPGKLRSSIDVRGCERRALLALGDLSWIALNIRGSAVHVEVRESEPLPMMVDPHMPCNVTAARSGQIISMLVYDGQPLKAIGDSVLEGDIIVSGIMEDRLGQNQFKHARATVNARVQHEITVKIPLNQTEFVETGEVKIRRFVHVFGWDLPFFWPSKIERPYRVERGKSMLKAGETELPVGILKEKYVLMKEIPVTYNEDEAKLLALKELSARQKSDLDGTEILDKTAVGKLDGESFTITAEYVCMMDIATEKEILKSD